MRKTNKNRAIKLRNRIIRSLRTQGFRVANGAILPPADLSKDKVRELHKTAVAHRIHKAKEGLIRHEAALLDYIASGTEVDPHRICPTLVEVKPNSKEELLFRYAGLHWSIPVSSGYGRRLRFLVLDENNGKLIGLIGLGDPVYNLKPRDEWVGWTKHDRRQRLKNVMDAFVLGSVPPYSYLLCGKLVAMLATSDTIRRKFKNKYGGARSVISNVRQDGRLALITTASALGRSSVYNRLRLDSQVLYYKTGFTKGSGEFHFANGLYAAISEFANKNCRPTAKQRQWGIGFRNRREVIRKSLPMLGVSSSWVYHGIEREVYAVPLAYNTREFLCGKHEHLNWFHHSEEEIFRYFRRRWMIPRASWDERFKSWSKDSWSIWLN